MLSTSQLLHQLPHLNVLVLLQLLELLLGYRIAELVAAPQHLH
jgi:hypothetical protein